MADTLIIVESPTKARTISRFLSGRYQIKASLGHVRDLPKSQFGIDLDKDYEPKYITIRGKGELLKELRTAAKKAKKVYLATDPDREGEAISWHLAEALKLEKGSANRIEFREITAAAVKEAIKNPRPIDQDFVDAQQARRVLDRIVGYKLSPLLWRKLRYGLSAGRVQSVAVALICDREREIEGFVSEEYWTLEVSCQGENGALKAKLIELEGAKPDLKSETQVNGLIASFDPACRVLSFKKGERRRLPQPPYITSTLQQDASRRLGFTARKTMMLAQQLYEGIELAKEGAVGLITYMRTDSVNIADSAYQQAQEYISTNFGNEYGLKTKRKFSSGRNVQEAHEAIRPTDIFRTPDNLKSQLSRDQLRLYRLIWERFLASQMAAAIFDYVTADLKNKEAVFRLNGSVEKFPGFLKVLRTEDKDQEEDLGFLPILEVGQSLKVEEWLPKQHFTQPPNRFSEAQLIKTMEDLGIGRPSTYAPTIDTIQKREYVNRQERRFYPTELGHSVTDLLREYFSDLIDTDFTAQLEEQLDLVEAGKLNWIKAIDDFYLPFAELLAEAEKNIPVKEVEDEVTDEICELCGRNMVIKRGRFGSFLACPGYPECKNTKNLTVKLDIACPFCKEGTVVERRSRKGRLFYGCSNYPKCNFVSWDKPVEKTCPECQYPVMAEKRMVKKNVMRYTCLNPECKHVLEEAISTETEGDK